jgi:hypothetical protein
VYVQIAGILPTAIAVPSTDSIVNGCRMAITPDRLVDRAESVRSAISLLIASLGPLAAGVQLGACRTLDNRRLRGVQTRARGMGTLSPVVRRRAKSRRARPSRWTRNLPRVPRTAACAVVVSPVWGPLLGRKAKRPLMETERRLTPYLPVGRVVDR